MDSEYCYRFILLDFGHPMNTNSINNIIKSLENTLTLGLAFTRNLKEIIFGITILNSDFSIFGLQSHLRKNYDLIIKNLNIALKSEKTNSRVTVQEYKYLLRNSIEIVLREFQKFRKSTNTSDESKPWKIQLAVVTKKTASVLADILTEVTNKLEKNIPSISSVKNIKIVQILKAEEEICRDSGGNKLINWMFCSDNIHSLNCFFKEWLLNQKQQLRILLSKDLEVKCDVEDCLINPCSMTIGGRFDLFNDIRSKITNSSLDIMKPGYELEVINRLPVSGLCPTFVYNIPRRIYTTVLSSLKWIDSQVNIKIFKELCQELYQTGQGLLAKSVLPTEKGEIKTFHFLTSDGDILLMSDVASEELYLPTRVTFSKAVDFQLDENAASMIKTCFDKIKLLDEYNPKNFPSGVYDYLKDYLSQTERSKSLFGLDPDVKLFGKKCDKKKRNITDEKSDMNENRKKKPKPSSVEIETTHPALLSPNVVDKYRKINSQVFNLLELGKDYTM